MSDINVRFLKNAGGGVDVAILVTNAKLKLRGRIRPWWSIADFEQYLPVAIPCEGSPLKPKLILKVYCKPAGAQAVAIKRRMSIRSLRGKNRRMLIGGPNG